MKRTFLFTLFLIFSIQFAFPVYAAPAVKKTVKPAPKITKKTPSKLKKTSSAVSSVGVSYSLRKDKKALTVAFSNLKKAKSVFYTLSYQTQGKYEGVSGTITPSKNQETRQLLFGTCSNKVCRYHKSIKNMRLEVSVDLLSGKTMSKNYKIKI